MIVADAGLDRWYERRAAVPPRPEPTIVPVAAWAQVPTRAGAAGLEADICIDGMVCASCAWVSERVLLATPGVLDARVAAASGRATLVWDPGRVDLATLAGRVAAIGYRPRPAGTPPRVDDDLAARAGFAVFAAMNVMGVSAALYAGWFDGMGVREAALFRWVSLLLATPVVFWSARPILRGAVAGVRARVAHVDLPVAVGIVSMYAHGVWATLRGEDGWLDSLAMLVALLLVGRVLEQRGRRSAAAAAAALAGQAPVSARRVVADRLEEVAASALVVGDVLEVGLGEEIAADGQVLASSGPAGAARVQMAIVTGESAPVARGVGDDVVAGARVEAGTLRVRVDRVGSDTLVQRMAKALAEGIDRPLPRTLADSLSVTFTGLTLALALIGGLAWGIVAGPRTAEAVTMAVLVVACPCALALAGPLSTAAGLGAAASRGLLVRDGAALRRLTTVDVLAFDKTGTLTGGTPDVVEATHGTLRVAVALERASAHPVARAIRREATLRGIPFPVAVHVEEHPGVGITGFVDGERWSIVRDPDGVRLVRGPSSETAAGAHDASDVVARDHRIVLRDRSRPDAGTVVEALRAKGLRVALLSGDREDVAARIGAELSVDEAHGAMRPEDKDAWIAARQREGHRVLFVGDGVNDGPALVRADVSAAMASGAASSVAAADLVVVGDGLAPLLAGIGAAARTERAIRVATVRSVVYNVLAVGAALAGWVNPLVAALLMPVSSAMVAWTAHGVRRGGDT